ncbi:hypothetical protein HN371_23335 [Candidatus Poribacteria bacterium]|jgi:hypothetical protein|nr:hypothetical protein [Candidatus Poribacteria bacterium]MBT5532694.1 hypothetical protein [Candidatus Poribacteria bacterium]MBT5714575.1 hypothetical protein [Candidatus Poribacteria bacterium]MBT7101489.1 hypothetical protein [Candidatus Poribacteria bacterium]MBT7808302.1 hypothetical protein [Candidatus Poribacteria bacterium]
MLNVLSLLRGGSRLNIEHTYKVLDAALSEVRGGEPTDDSPAEVSEDVTEALEAADTVLAFKGEKAWDGMFREMHEYLAKIHMELRHYDIAEEQAQLVQEYDRHEGEYLIKQVAAHKAGERLEDFDPSSVDEADD